MIPKVIHYCWFGHGPKPDLANKCIKSWRRYLPNYEIKEWNENNFDINIIPYVREAYDEKKYAFVSDYARFWILYHYGGIYFDTDVELIRSFEDIIIDGSFMGCEEDSFIDKVNGDMTYPLVAPGLCLGSPSGHQLYREILDHYSSLRFKNEDGSLNLKTVVLITTDTLIAHGLKKMNGIQKCADVTIYPKEYFCPLSYKTGEFNKTDKTVSIHHYAASWLPWDKQLNIKLNIKYYRIKKRFPHIYYYFIYWPHYKFYSYLNS